MGIVAGLAGAAAGASLLNTVSGGSIFGGGGGGSSGGSATGSYGGSASTYVPQAQPAADQIYQDLFNAEAPYAKNLPGQVIPGYQAYAQNIQNNPYAGLQMGGANQVAAYGPGVAQGELAAAGQLQNAGNQILTSAFDPQTALYNQQYNQASQAANVANAQAGVAGPYAAGTLNQATQNFNNSWEQQQAQREAAGIQAAGQAYSGAGQLGSAGLGTYQTSQSAPYQTYLGQQNTDISALSGLSGGINTAFGPATDVSNALASYLGIGQRASGLAQAGQAAGYAQNVQQSALLGQDISGLGKSLGTLFAGSGGGGYNNGSPPITASNISDYYSADPFYGT